jgi:hypothetical protein
MTSTTRRRTCQAAQSSVSGLCGDLQQTDTQGCQLDVGWSLRNAAPPVLTTGRTDWARPLDSMSALGSCSLMDQAAKGAVRMKITSSTSMTSTSGVTLISLMAGALWRW